MSNPTIAPTKPQPTKGADSEPQEPRGERVLRVNFADGQALSGPNSSETSITSRLDPKTNGWDVRFEADAQRFVLYRYERGELVNRVAVPHSSVRNYVLVLS